MVPAGHNAAGFHKMISVFCVFLFSALVFAASTNSGIGLNLVSTHTNRTINSPILSSSRVNNSALNANGSISAQPIEAASQPGYVYIGVNAIYLTDPWHNDQSTYQLTTTYLPKGSLIRTDIEFSPFAAQQFRTYSAAGYKIVGMIDIYTMGAQSFVTTSAGDDCSLDCNWNLSDWEGNVSLAVNDYPFIHIWEIWNEPAGFHSGSLNGNLWESNLTSYSYNYYLMLRGAYGIIKGHNSSDIVLAFGGLSTCCYYLAGSPTYEEQFASLVWGYGAAKYCDGISLHAYSKNTYLLSSVPTSGTGPTQKTATVQTIWQSILGYYEQLSGKPVWITETGIPENNGTNLSLDDNLQKQATFLNQSFTFLLSLPYVKAVLWFDFWRLNPGSGNLDYSLVDPATEQLRPSYPIFLKFAEPGVHNTVDATQTSTMTTQSSSQTTTTKSSTTSSVQSNFILNQSGSVEFQEEGLPISARWAVTFDGSKESSTNDSIYFQNIKPGVYAWNASTAIFGSPGIQYNPLTSSGIANVTSQQVYVLPYFARYELFVNSTPAGLGVTNVSGFAWISAGAEAGISAVPNGSDYFAFWSTSSPAIVIDNQFSTNTTITVNGPGSITANFAKSLFNLTLIANGLSSTSNWSASLNSGAIILNLNSSGRSINFLKLIPGIYSWSVFPVSTNVSGTRYVAKNSSGIINLTQDIGLAVTYQVQYLVKVDSMIGQTSGSGWYYNGSTVHFNVLSNSAQNSSSQRELLVGWTCEGVSCLDGFSNETNLILNSPVTETAVWQIQYYVSIGEFGYSSPVSGWYNGGSTLRISSNNESGMRFARWQGTGNGSYSGSDLTPLINVGGPISEIPSYNPDTNEVLVQESGLPQGTPWELTFNGTAHSINQASFGVNTSSGKDLVWSVQTPIYSIEGSVRYIALHSSGFVNITSEGSISIEFQPQFKLTCVENIAGNQSVEFVYWVPSGSVVPLETPQEISQYEFLDWNSSSPMLTLSNASASSSLATVKGPGTVVANYAFKAISGTGSTLSSIFGSTIFLEMVPVMAGSATSCSIMIVGTVIMRKKSNVREP